MTAPEPAASATLGPHGGAPSLWVEQLGPRTPRPALQRDLDVDIAIIGAGFSGLWTAHGLLRQNSGLRIAILEREYVGFGASGRNGGWLMAAPPADTGVWERSCGLDAVRRGQRALIGAIDDVEQVVSAAGIDCDLRRGGELRVATDAVQVARVKESHQHALHEGWPAEGLRWLPKEELDERVLMRGALGALSIDPAATIHPAKLAVGLAAEVERMGATIYEHTSAQEIHARTPRHSARVLTPGGTVRADQVVLATEAWTIEQPGEGRRYLPLRSLMIATEPISAAQWDEIGWSRGESIGDARRLFMYAQRTADDRIAIGGRGAPYKLGSALAGASERNPAVRARLEETVCDYWPQLADTAVTHHWGGSIAMPRDWCASTGVDQATGIAWIGGYTGHGVGASNALGRTLADLLLHTRSDLTTLPWATHRSRRWEPEPLRWIASQAIVRLMGSADEHEASSGRESRRAALVQRVIGG